MSKSQSSNCHRCGTVLLPGAEVCSTCCAPQTSGAPEAPHVTGRQPVAGAADPPAAPQSGLAAWPFGQADAEAAAQVAARAVISDVHAELSHYSSQASTHVLASIPAQRPAQPAEQLESVPAHGPNPFLAAARVLHARDELEDIEGYPF